MFERGNIAGLSEHFVDFANVLGLEVDMLPGILFDHGVVSFNELQQLLIVLQRGFLVSERFAKNIADIVLVRFQQWSNP